METKQTSFRETKEFLRGRTAEQLVAGVLQQRGWFVIPSYDYSGEDSNKAPRLQGLRAAHVIPDLDVCKEGIRRWVEVKCKESASFTYITKQLEHGIPTRHFEAYMEVQKQTGCEVWLCVYEESTGDVLIARLNDLAQNARFYGGGKMSRGGMVFFPRKEFFVGVGWINNKQ